MLGDGVELAVGDPIANAEAKLTGAAVADRRVEEGPLGRREIRSYELGGTRFLVVMEPFERKGEVRVAAIYLR
jgi:hypothetical protein